MADHFLHATLGTVRGWANELAEALDTPPIGLHFFTLHMPNARQITADLLAQDIRVRDCTSFGLPNYIRIATRKPKDNRKLVEVLSRLR
jgi:histidinol-phosphate aminotransferase